MPPLAWSVCEYAVLTTADDKLVKLMFSAGGASVMENVADLLCVGLPLSVTITVNVKVPADVGVPEIKPEGASVIPPGKLPEVTLQT